MDFTALQELMWEMEEYSVPESENERWRDIVAAYDILNYDRILLLLEDI